MGEPTDTQIVFLRFNGFRKQHHAWTKKHHPVVLWNPLKNKFYINASFDHFLIGYEFTEDLIYTINKLWNQAKHS